MGNQRYDSIKRWANGNGQRISRNWYNDNKMSTKISDYRLVCLSAPHTWYRMQTCTVHRDLYTVDQEPIGVGLTRVAICFFLPHYRRSSDHLLTGTAIQDGGYYCSDRLLLQRLTIAAFRLKITVSLTSHMSNLSTTVFGGRCNQVEQPFGNLQ